MKRASLDVARDRGAATVWTVALTFVLVLAGLVSLAAAQQALVRQRAATAADLSAIAAAQAIDNPCDRARTYAERNGATLTGCSVVETGDQPDVTVDVRMHAPSLVVHLMTFLGHDTEPIVARSRAGAPG